VSRKTREEGVKIFLIPLIFHLKIFSMQKITYIKRLASLMISHSWVVFFLLCTLGLQAQVRISSDSPYKENFDEMGTTATTALPSGWKTDNDQGVRKVGSYFAAGTTTTRIGGNNMTTTAANGIYNFGAGDSGSVLDRAIGGLSSSSSSKSINIYLQLTNVDSSPIDSLTVSYAVEKYRNGKNASGFSMTLFYSTDGLNWVVADSVFITAFNPDSDNKGYTTAPDTIRSVTNQTLKLPSPLACGGIMYLAWNYSVTNGSTTTNAQALALDDVTIQPTHSVSTGTISTKEEGFKVHSTHGHIIVKGALEAIEVFNVFGEKIASQQGGLSICTIPIPYVGVYIVKSGKNVRKVILN
jgi:hypothetical protein